MSKYHGYRRYNPMVADQEKESDKKRAKKAKNVASDVEAFLAAGGKITKCKPLEHNDFNRQSCKGIV